METWPFPFIFILEVRKLRYHYEKPAEYSSMYGYTYTCDHPIYYNCTLFKINDRGLAVIQQRHDEIDKSTWWGEIDPWLTDEIYLHPGFQAFFDERADEPENGLYPTVTVRQIMWALKMKPMVKKRWETCFDRRKI